MKRSDFRIGLEFMMSDARWRCTDVGTRTVTAINLSEPDALGYRGPPYGIVETVIDEYDLPACELPDSPRSEEEEAEEDRERRTWAIAAVEAQLRRLDVERVHFGQLVTLTTRERDDGFHSHGEGETLSAALEALERRPRR